MNRNDLNELTEYFHSDTRYLHDRIDDALKGTQDHAYALGLKRGKQEMTELAQQLMAAKNANDQREWVACLDAIYKLGEAST